MKKVLITQRLESFRGQWVWVDSLEHAYIDYFSSKGFYVAPVPNADVSSLKRRLQNTELIILSGGGDADLNDKRGTIEKYLIAEGLKRRIPILGICRGMQFLNLYFGGTIKPIKGHVISKHKIMITSLFDPKDQEGVVNSYHDWGVLELASNLDFFALSNDGMVEGIFHKKEKIIGVQWHPERKNKDGKHFSEWIDKLIFEHLGV